MTAYPQQINDRQNEDDFLNLLYAADAGHASAQSVERMRWLLVGSSAGLAIVAAFRPGLGRPLSIVGVFVVALTAVVIPQLSRHRSTTAAMIQEAFDVNLYELGWNNQIGARPLLEQVHGLAGEFAGNKDDKRDWYVDVAGLPRAYAVLLCQRENLVWDFRQRRAWGLRIAAATASWIFIGVFIALLLDWSVRQLFLQWLAPSAAILAAGFQESQAHSQVADEKESLALEVESKLAAAPAGDPDAAPHGELLGFARCIQDRLAESRKQTARVPTHFYQRRRPSEELVAAASVDQLRRRLLGGP